MADLLTSSSQPGPSEKAVAGIRGVRAIALFMVVLGASVSMTLLTDYVEGELGYQQPYMIIYIAHSCMMLIMPIHLTYLSWTTQTPVSRHVAELKHTLAQQFPHPTSPGINLTSLTRTVIASATAYTATGLAWYVAVGFAPISDVTAIWSTNAFWTYALSVLASTYCVTVSSRGEHKLEFRKLLAVSMASLGVAAVIYGGRRQNEQSRSPSDSRKLSSTGGSNLVLLGDALALISALSTAAWAVWYDRAVALPEDEDSRPPTPQSADGIDSFPSEYQPLRMDDSRVVGEAIANPSSTYSLPLGLHANFFAWTIGVVSFLLFWIPLLLINVLELGQPVKLPPSPKVWLYVGFVSIMSMAYNAGYCILLSAWGPVLIAVANLLTIVLVLAGDALFGNGMQTITAGTLLGSTMIIGAFGLLARDAAMKPR